MRPRALLLAAARSTLLFLLFPIALGARTHIAKGFEPHQITILQTTDIHDHANGSDHVGLDLGPTATSTTGAYARIAAYVNKVRATTKHPVILVDSGDWTMGTLYDLTLGNKPLALYFLDLMHYDAVTLGNHEFDYSSRGLAQIIGTAKTSFGFHTPIVASNMDLNGSTDITPLFGPGKPIETWHVERLSNGMNAAFIGLMGESAATDAPASAPVSFSKLSTQYAAIQQLVDKLRNEEHAQIVIALSHSGTDASGTSGEDVDLARHVTGIDVIASGHTHTPLNAPHAVKNGTWTTQIIDAGAFGTNVARLDLDYSPVTKSTSRSGFSNLAMTDAALSSAGAGTDATVSAVVSATDQQLNASLGPVLSTSFSDYRADSIGTGIYHVVGTAAQDMVYNGVNPVPSPNGLGDLAADAVRNVPNSIIAATLAGVGGNPANLPGYDFTPYQAAIVGTGVLRGKLPAATPLTFTDVYNVLPLGISPDSTQALPVGYPLISVYITVADAKKLAALQLVAQSGLVPSDFYLNISGIQYGLKSAELDTYFKFATAAAVLQVTSAKAAAGSTAALQALGALATMGTDSGSALIAASTAGNPYASALVKLNDASATTTNLGVVGQVGAAAIAGTNAVSSLVVSKAIAAIGTMSGFAPTDLTNTGTATALDDNTRIRFALDLYTLLLAAAVQTQYGIAIPPYSSATDTTPLSAADMPRLLANRINAKPTSTTVQELKEWMALLSYVGTGLGGSIGSTYASTPDFTQFPNAGAAVKNRNAGYPLASIGQLASTIGGLESAP